MQLLLICLSVITICLSGFYLFNKKFGQRKMTMFLVLWLPTVISLILVGYRWQFLPMLVGLVLVTIILIFKKNDMKQLVLKTIGLSLLVVTFTIVTIAPQWLFPYFQFKKPSGDYQVGVIKEFAVDTSRKITTREGTDTNRELPLTIYYPAKVKNEKMMPYTNDIKELSNNLSKAQGLPAIITQHFSSIKTNAFLEAKSIDGSYPVVLFSHGMGSYGTQSSFQLAELASHGYIVISIEHPEDAAMAVTKDGQVIPYKNTKVLGANQKDLEYLNTHNIEWQNDVEVVLDYLEKNTQQNVLQQMDLKKIGYLGFSYGGATALQSLINNEKIKTAIDLDGALFGEDVPEEGIQKPFLLLNSQASINSAEGMEGQTEEEAAYFKELGRKNSRVKGKLVEKKVLKNSNHVSFTDLSAASRILNEKNGNAMDNYDEINRITLAFFNEYLK